VPLLVATFVAVTLWEFARFGIDPGSAELARIGGASLGALANLVWWKLLVTNLLHGGVLHLALNVAVTLIVGVTLERHAGAALVLAVAAVSALGSSVCAIALDQGVSVGASGMAFGLMGAAFVFDRRAATPVGQTAAATLPINLIATFAVPGISVGGHLGGLAGGLLVGVGLLRWRRRPRIMWGAAAASVVLAAGVALAPVLAPAGARAAVQPLAAGLLERELEQGLVSGDGDAAHVRSASCSPLSGTGRYLCSLDGDRDVEGRWITEFRPGTDEWTLS
jgi:membrane associated rhomboid family serine protease